MKYQYIICQVNRVQKSIVKIEDEFNVYGKKGWELVSVSIEPSQMVAVFKRQVLDNKDDM